MNRYTDTSIRALLWGFCSALGRQFERTLWRGIW